jgi:hypothetical protein
VYKPFTNIAPSNDNRMPMQKGNATPQRMRRMSADEQTMMQNFTIPQQQQQQQQPIHPARLQQSGLYLYIITSILIVLQLVPVHN